MKRPVLIMQIFLAAAFSVTLLGILPPKAMAQDPNQSLRGMYLENCIEDRTRKVGAAMAKKECECAARGVAQRLPPDQRAAFDLPQSKVNMSAEKSMAFLENVNTQTGPAAAACKIKP